MPPIVETPAPRPENTRLYLRRFLRRRKNSFQSISTECEVGGVFLVRVGDVGWAVVVEARRISVEDGVLLAHAVDE